MRAPHTRGRLHARAGSIARTTAGQAAQRTMHPQREYLASHLERVASQVRNSPVASEPLTPTEQVATQQALSHAMEQATAPQSVA